MDPPAQVIAVDWSGRATRAAESIWLACVRDGVLVELENGRDRDDVIDDVIERISHEPRTVVGLDFAFSLPRWFCREQGWQTAPAVWEAMRTDGEALLAACEPPWWGRPGTSAPLTGEALRETDKPHGAKSVFQIGGAGAVGTGSIRGMPQLLRLAAAGAAIWPFNAPRWPTVVEIYPRLLTGPVIKSRHRARRAYLDQHHPDQPSVLRERAAGSEDAFDAAVSALVMAERLFGLHQLPAALEGGSERIEGAIFDPAR